VDKETVPVPEVRRVLRLGLGGFWIVAGLLQLQPGMFTMAMLHNVMQPLAAGQPSWLAGLIDWATAVMTLHLVLWNLLIVVVQLAIGVLLWWGRRPDLVRAGLVLSLVWTAVVWLFGEGLGGELTGSASVLTGAPGSVLLYGWLAVVLLLPDRAFALTRRGFVAVRDAPGILLGIMALQQLAPVFFTPIGLSSQFQSTLMMQPAWFQATLAPVVAWSYHAPVPFNLLVVLVLGVLAWRLTGRRADAFAFGLAALFLGFVWWWGEGFGGVLTGMATDLNTAPLVALMLVPAWYGWRARQAAARTGGGVAS
jgi:hypothetical protein